MREDEWDGGVRGMGWGEWGGVGIVGWRGTEMVGYL